MVFLSTNSVTSSMDYQLELELANIAQGLRDLSFSDQEEEDDISPPIVQHPDNDLDLDQLNDLVDALCDPNATSASDFHLSEELCVKIEMHQALLNILTPSYILRLQDIIPEVYINSDCTGKRRFKFQLRDAVPDNNWDVPDLCVFRSQLRTLREFLLFCSSLSAKECDTIACFQIEELVMDIHKKTHLPVRTQCDCPDMKEPDSESSEAEYVQELLSSCSEDSFSIKQMFELEDIIDPKEFGLSPQTNEFHHRGISDLMDNCHCSLCVERRKQDDSLGETSFQSDLSVVWEAFYNVQCFLEEHAFSSDLSPMLYIEQRLCRVTHYKIMKWFYANDLHSHSALYDCPCSDN